MNTLLHGDCRELLASLEADSIDAIITDPPYELGFMKRSWDSSGVAFDPATWAACHRVLKPGGRMLAFAAPRTMHRIWCAIEDGGFVVEDTIMWLFGSGFPKHKSKLKPAYEPICVARKGSVSELNVDNARIAAEGGHNEGRWPANIALDEAAADLLDEQSGDVSSSGGHQIIRGESKNVYGKSNQTPFMSYGDSGGASRFFYVAKACRSERDAGLEDMPLANAQKLNGSGMAARREAAGHGKGRNTHPTVKPVDLMRWLVRLVTLEGQTVLDPFMGSGTTGVSCVEEARNFIGCELEHDHIEIARRRIYINTAHPLRIVRGGVMTRVTSHMIRVMLVTEGLLLDSAFPLDVFIMSEFVPKIEVTELVVRRSIFARLFSGRLNDLNITQQNDFERARQLLHGEAAQ